MDASAFKGFMSGTHIRIEKFNIHLHYSNPLHLSVESKTRWLSSNAWPIAKVMRYHFKYEVIERLWLLSCVTFMLPPLMEVTCRIVSTLWRGSHGKKRSEMLGPQAWKGTGCSQQPHGGARHGSSRVDFLQMRPQPPPMAWLNPWERERVRSTQLSFL